MSHCTRCGTCCTKGGPALHGEDIGLLARGTLTLSGLVTVRAGMWVRDPFCTSTGGGLGPLSQDIVKPASRESQGGEGHTCIFLRYDSHTRTHGCAIHTDRPLECSTLFCEDTAPLQRIYATDRLTRARILDEHARSGADVAKLPELLEAYDGLCPASTFSELAALPEIQLTEVRRTELAELCERDRLFRARAPVPRELHPFLLGTPLTTWLAGFGLRASESGGRLTVLLQPNRTRILSAQQSRS